MAVIPPDIPSAARAMTLGSPPVLSLWPPQLSFLASESEGPSPLDRTTRRLVLSFPTSAGKTLLAQILILVHLASTDGDVCVVAPTHSLVREISVGLDRRLRTLGYQLHREGPVGFALPPRPPAARVSVMTPEKLAAMLRSDPEEQRCRWQQQRLMRPPMGQPRTALRLRRHGWTTPRASPRLRHPQRSDAGAPRQPSEHSEPRGRVPNNPDSFWKARTAAARVSGSGWKTPSRRPSIYPLRTATGVHSS